MAKQKVIHSVFPIAERPPLGEQLYSIPNTGLYQTKSQFMWPAHYHQAIEVVCIPNDISGTIACGGMLYDVRKQRCFAIAPGRVHSYDLHSDEQLPFVILLINTSALLPLLNSMQNDGSVTKKLENISFDQSKNFKEIYQFVKRLSLLAQNAGSVKFELNSHMFKDAQLIIKIVELIVSVNNAGPEKSDEKVIRKVIDIIENQYESLLTLEQIANQVNLSKFYLLRLFKQSTGTTIHDYLLTFRINQAKTLLCEKNQSITEICLSCGFNDPSYFTKVFKLYTGVNPSEFRKE